MNEKSLEEIAAALRELVKWTRFAGLRQVKEVLLTALDNDQRRLIYHVSDGELGSVSIAKLAGTSDRSVRRYWESWAKLGLMEVVRVRGGDRYKRLFELDDVGIEIPDAPVLINHDSCP